MVLQPQAYLGEARVTSTTWFYLHLAYCKGKERGLKMKALLCLDKCLILAREPLLFPYPTIIDLQSLHTAYIPWRTYFKAHTEQQVYVIYDSVE